MRFRIVRDGNEEEIEAVRLGEGRFRITRDGKSIEVEAAVRSDGTILFEAAGERVTAAGIARAGERQLRVGGVTVAYEVSRGSRSHRAGHEGDLSSPAPGVVAEIRVAAGDRIKRGDTLVVLESMKMFFPVLAPRDGVVGRVLCAAKQTVPAGVPLVEMAADGGGDEARGDGG